MLPPSQLSRAPMPRRYSAVTSALGLSSGQREPSTACSAATAASGAANVMKANCGEGGWG